MGMGMGTRLLMEMELVLDCMVEVVIIPCVDMFEYR